MLLDRHRKRAAIAGSVVVIAFGVSGCGTSAGSVQAAQSGTSTAPTSSGASVANSGSPSASATSSTASHSATSSASGTATPKPTTTTHASTSGGLTDPAKKEIAMELVSSAENSSLNWRAQYGYIQDIQDGRGYTAGIIGFCSGTGDMLQLVQHYVALKPGNVLAKYVPALTKDNGTATHAGLDPTFVGDWKTAAADPAFQQAQDGERDAEYFNPAVSQAKADGLGTLGQFIYYDAMVMHGPGTDRLSFGGLRSAALRKAKTPAQGGDEYAYLSAFLDVRRAVMKSQPDWSDTSRIDTEQRVFLGNHNLNLNTPLHWSTYGDQYTIN